MRKNKNMQESNKTEWIALAYLSHFIKIIKNLNETFFLKLDI